MAALINIIVQLLADVARLVVLRFRPTRSVQAENLFLRRQLALFKERGIKPRRVDAATRISLAVAGRLFEWRDALFVVQVKNLHPVAARRLAPVLALEVPTGPAEDSG